MLYNIHDIDSSGECIMEFKPLFPDQLEMAEVASGGMDAHKLILSLPVTVSNEIAEDALMDFKWAYAFINESCDNSSATFKAYRNAIERLLLFMWYKQNKSLKDINKHDFKAFLEFSQHPDEEWIGLHSRRFDLNRRPVRDWRPFTLKPPKGKTQEDMSPTYKVAEGTTKSVISRLSSFFSTLVYEEYIPSNPAFLLKNKSKYIAKRDKLPVKRLTNRQLEYCLEEAEIMAFESPEIHERTRFIINFMLSTYVRISEMVPGDRHIPLMGDFLRDEDGHWWFNVIGGKGNKNRQVALSDEDVASLARYRESRNLTPYPTYNDSEPLITRIRGTGQVRSGRNIRLIVQNCFDRTQRRLMDDNFVQDASTLHEATVHWLRHTGISEDLNANDRPLSHVADDAGHSDLKTTSLYIDSDLKDRSRSKRAPHKLR
jgi:site-specific recombinase XerD